MRKITLLFLVVGCLGTYAQKKTPNQTELNASKIIGFSNSVITLSNSYLSTIRNYESINNTAESNIKKLSRNINTRPFFINCQGFTIQPNQLTEYNTKAKSVQTFTEKNKIQLAVAAAQKSSNNTSKWCAKISDYFSNETYKSDTDFAQFPIMQDSLLHAVRETHLSWNNASKLASKAGDDAELVILKGSKIADFVIPMKTDLISINNIIDDLNNENSDLSEIKTKLNIIAASVEKNKDISTKNTSKLKDVYYKEVYQNFYRESSTCISYLTSFIQKIEDKEPSNNLEQLYSYISSSYNKLVTEYNTFVSQ